MQKMPYWIAGKGKILPSVRSKDHLRPGHKIRGNGTGTVYRRGKTWTAAKTLGYYVSEDKLHREVRTKGGFKTKREALEYLAILGREPATKARTFRQVYDLCFRPNQASASTMGCYQAAMKWFKPVWGINWITSP